MQNEINAWTLKKTILCFYFILHLFFIVPHCVYMTPPLIRFFIYGFSRQLNCWNLHNGRACIKKFSLSSFLEMFTERWILLKCICWAVGMSKNPGGGGTICRLVWGSSNVVGIISLQSRTGPVQGQYRARTGFSLWSFSHRDPLFSLQGPCFHYRDFPVRKTSQGKPCFHYREWVCSEPLF